MNLGFEEIIVISANKNYNIDYLLKRIKYYQTSRNVYVVGHTNAGKSSLINKLIKNYSDREQELTMSPLPSTTLNTVNIEINDYLTIIDTPGLDDSGSITNHVDQAMVKKLSCKKEIKPRTYQLRKNQSIIIEDMVRIDYVEGERNSFTLFASNDFILSLLFSSIHTTILSFAPLKALEAIVENLFPLKFFKLIYSNFTLLNIVEVLVVLEVSKFAKFNEVNDVHPSNIQPISPVCEISY